MGAVIQMLCTTMMVILLVHQILRDSSISVVTSLIRPYLEVVAAQITG